MIKKIITFLIGLLLSLTYSCADLSQQLNDRISDPMDSNRIIPVYFATNRKMNGKSFSRCEPERYNNVAGDKLQYGICEINVPENHSVGSLGYSNSPSDSPDNYFMTGNFFPVTDDSMFDRLNEGSGDIILFVHGFNVDFKEAVLRSAQIKYDLKFNGDVVLYSWPAGSSSDSFLGEMMLHQTYSDNAVNASNSVNYFADFLEKLKEKVKRPVHLIVHSMGHQVVIPALTNLHYKNRKHILKRIIMNAPDFPVGPFEDLAPNIVEMADHVTLYCSPSDNALNVSELVNKRKRAGSCFKIPGMDVINVQEVDEPVLGVAGLGHGYYSSRPIITDLYQLMLGIKVNKRLFIRTKIENNTPLYILRK